MAQSALTIMVQARRANGIAGDAHPSPRGDTSAARRPATPAVTITQRSAAAPASLSRRRIVEKARPQNAEDATSITGAASANVRPRATAAGPEAAMTGRGRAQPVG